MSIFEAIILGIVQGLTEFLPISSSGHLRIVPAVMGWEDPGAGFTAVIQIGTMAAVLLYFKDDIWKITTAVLRGLARRAREDDADDIRMGGYIALGTVPIVILGLAFSDQIENDARNLYLIGGMLIAMGLFLGLVDALAKHVRTIESVGKKDALIIGLAQSMALIPGVSRSGATITFGLLRGFTRRDAARFSFLLSIPAVVLSGVYQLGDAFNGSAGAGPAAVIVATIASFVVGYASIAFLLKWLGDHTMGIFVAYRLVVGVAVVTLAATGAIS
ncbi:MAG: undecaprenyl-diphosphate phosphatase [Solirubrobacterales bacterium]